MIQHLRHQLPVIASLGRAALGLPGGATEAVLPPRPIALVKDYLREVGGEYRGELPPHLFPQWGFPLAARTLAGQPYPMRKVLNGGCRLEVRAPLPVDRELHVRARLVDVDDDGRRAVLRQEVITGTSETPDALIATLYAVVPLEQRTESPGRFRRGSSAGAARRAGGESARRPQASLAKRHDTPDDAREIQRWRLAADAGSRFAILTGDVNPVHWSARYARAAGFRAPILHGFATMARAIEGLARARFVRIATWDCRFTRPLVLPAQVGLYTQADQAWVGDAAGGPAYLTATFTRES